jgi:nitric oxide reductase subunit B
LFIGQILFTGADIMAGQHIFQKYCLMQYDTIFGHGVYLGPDFTAQYFHRAGLRMVDFHQQNDRSKIEAIARYERNSSRTSTTRKASD